MLLFPFGLLRGFPTDFFPFLFYDSFWGYLTFRFEALRFSPPSPPVYVFEGPLKLHQLCSGYFPIDPPALLLLPSSRTSSRHILSELTAMHVSFVPHCPPSPTHFNSSPRRYRTFPRSWTRHLVAMRVRCFR